MSRKSPFEDRGKQEQENGSNKLLVEDEDEAFHANIDCGLGEQGHARLDNLDQDSEHVWILQSHNALASLYIRLKLEINDAIAKESHAYLPMRLRKCKENPWIS